MGKAIPLKIGNREIGRRSYIIAEAGTSYGGSVERARQYIEAAKSAGADAIKFQMFVPDDALFCPVKGDDRRMDRWRQSMLSLKEWRHLADVAQSFEIHFLASIFQPTAIRWLKHLNPQAVKVASRAALTFPYDAFDHPFIVSLGMCDNDDFIELSDRLHQKRKWVVWLLCRAEYPAPLNWLRLGDIAAHRRRGALVGISDHSASVIPAIAAMTAGAAMVEVHFALDKRHAGNDAPASLTMDELRTLCDARDAIADMRTPSAKIPVVA